MSLFKKIAIVGGAGDLGKYITAAILAEGQRFELTLISRKSSGNLLPSTVPARVIEVENYSDSEDLTLALTGQDVLLSFHNTAAAPGANSALLACAIKAGVKRFVPSDYSLDITHPSAIAQAAPGSTISGRAALINSIINAAEQGEITYTQFIPSGWMDWGLANGFMGFDIKARKARLVDNGAHTATGCTQPFIAEAVISMLKQPPNETENKMIHIAEVKYSGQELLSLFEDETGSKWEVEDITPQGLLELADKAKMENNARLRTVSITLFLNFGGSGAAYFPGALTTPLKGSRYQRKTVRQIVKDAVEKAQSS